MPLFKKKKNQTSGSAYDGPPTLPAFIPASRRSLSLPALRKQYGSQEAQSEGRGHGGDSLDLDLDLRGIDGGDYDNQDGDATPRHSHHESTRASQPAYGHRTRVIVHGQDTWDIIEPVPAVPPAPLRSPTRADGPARKPRPHTSAGSAGAPRAPHRRSTLPEHAPLPVPPSADFRVSPVLSLNNNRAPPPAAAVQRIDIARRQSLRRSKGPTRLNVMLLGEAFTGKTSFVRALAESLGLGDQHGAADLDAADAASWSAETRAQAQTFGLRSRAEGLSRTRSMQTLDELEVVPCEDLLLRGVVGTSDSEGSTRAGNNSVQRDAQPEQGTRPHSRSRSRRASFASTYLSLGPAAPPQRLLLSLMDTPSLPHAPNSSAESHLAPILTEITSRYAHTLREETKLNRVPVKSGQVAGRHVNVVLWFIEPREVLEGRWWWEGEAERARERRRAKAEKAKAKAKAKGVKGVNGKGRADRHRRNDSEGTLKASVSATSDGTQHSQAAQVYEQPRATAHDRAASMQSLVENLQLDQEAKVESGEGPRLSSTSSRQSVRENEDGAGAEARAGADAEQQSQTHILAGGDSKPEAGGESQTLQGTQDDEDESTSAAQRPSQDERGANGEQAQAPPQPHHAENGNERISLAERPASASSHRQDPSPASDSEPSPSEASAPSDSSTDSDSDSDSEEDEDSEEEESYTPTLPPSSRLLLTHLLPLVPVIPIIARADTLSARDLARVREGVGRGWEEVVRGLREARKQRREGRAGGQDEEGEEGEEGEGEGQGDFGWDWMGRRPHAQTGRHRRRARKQGKAETKPGKGGAEDVPGTGPEDGADEPVKVVRLKSRGAGHTPLFFKFPGPGGRDAAAGQSGSMSVSSDGQSGVFHSDSEEEEDSSEAGKRPSRAFHSPSSSTTTTSTSLSSNPTSDTDSYDSHSDSDPSGEEDDSDSEEEDPTDPRHILGVQHIVPSSRALRRRWPLAVFAPEVESLRFRSAGEDHAHNSKSGSKSGSGSKSKKGKRPRSRAQPHLSRRYALVRIPHPSSSSNSRSNSSSSRSTRTKPYTNTYRRVLSPSQSDFPLLRALLLGTHTGRILEASRGRFEDWRVGVLDGRGGAGAGASAARGRARGKIGAGAGRARGGVRGGGGGGLGALME